MPPIIPLRSNTKDDTVVQLKETEDKKPHFLYTCVILDLMRPSWLTLSLMPLPVRHQQACNSHTDESESKPNHAPQGIFMPDALPNATFPISGLGDHLRICWVAYPEARHVSSIQKVVSLNHS